ncbi:hypothetical protein BJ322DRAFT_1042953 [Thelephora terrestris]|uniref:Uncharacterized protein n=1 Tax=Thelephora terrestris TaxID=56493 RepID=A0A9P6HKS0_9AGAM|nr:hypothetical protein BJ322DRAFT_1042953 [Thelephora terrestris]
MRALACVRAIRNLPDRVWAIAWNLTRPLLASCSADKTVRLYDCPAPPPSSGSPSHGSKFRLELTASITTGHAKTVRTLTCSPSGNTLATGSFDPNVGRNNRYKMGRRKKCLFL